MKRMFTGIALVAIFLFAATGGYLMYLNSDPVMPAAQTVELRTIELKGQIIRVSVADTESSRQQGLSGRPGLAADEGMLFVFPEDGEYAFWMKDMRFSIDMLWLGADGSVVYMAQNVSPDTYPEDFVSQTRARYVLELPAGYAKAYTVDIGDIVRL